MTSTPAPHHHDGGNHRGPSVPLGSAVLPVESGSSGVLDAAVLPAGPDPLNTADVTMLFAGSDRVGARGEDAGADGAGLAGGIDGPGMVVPVADGVAPTRREAAGMDWSGNRNAAAVGALLEASGRVDRARVAQPMPWSVSWRMVWPRRWSVCRWRWCWPSPAA